MYVGREIEEEQKGELEASPRRLNKGALAPFPHNKPLKRLSGSSLFSLYNAANYHYHYRA